ncbi:MAG: hypothetical protein E6G58_13325 [Actinobacteria bacterium]|nr:MAG: hypothetical protein E6G58_13325 [Actinomycetota bacterium]
MATQVIGGESRSRMSVALIALALVFAVFVMATQASSIWSTRTVSQIKPLPVHVSLSAMDLKELAKGAHLPAGCRVKYGCGDQGRVTNTSPPKIGHIRDGCRVKFGCEYKGSTTARP